VLATLDSDDADRLRDAAAASDTGAVLVATAERMLLVVPPFPVETTVTSNGADTGPLLELLARPRAIGVFLLRMGGYSVGFFRGDALIDSKTGGRFVKNRHRKGGQSQRRFDRIREKQTHEHFGDACDTAKRVLGPHDTEMERVFLGGDRHTLLTFRKECDAFDRYGPRLAARVLAVPGDPRLNLLAAMPREVWSSDVYVVTTA
jgi:peptide subunit release factor 1 (eRF1)